jgi:hypothetical protein
MWLAISESGRALVEKWGVAEGYEAKMHVTLAYPAGNIPHAKPRRENRVLRFL